jgi:small-conductance mechanosensitive channel
MEGYRFLGLAIADWALLLTLVPAALLVGWLIARTILALLKKVAARTGTVWDDMVVRALQGPLRLLIAVLIYLLFSSTVRISENTSAIVHVLVRTLSICAVSWLLVRFVNVGAKASEEALARNERDAGKRRAVRSEIVIIARIVHFVVVVLGSSLFLLQFKAVRTVGMGILASVGIGALVLGFALQRTIANLFAGLQIMFTQPIRIGDEVIVENEWGWVEDIGLTYVVIRVWDLRRIVLPISYFLEKPFQNWTKVSPELLGTVYVYCSYEVDIDRMREDLTDILKSTPLWDGKAQGIQVTNLTERTVEARILVSARNASDQWDLRCLVREAMLKFLQKEDGRFVPQVRLTMESGARNADR